MQYFDPPYWGGRESVPGDWETQGLWGTHMDWGVYAALEAGQYNPHDEPLRRDLDLR